MGTFIFIENDLGIFLDVIAFDVTPAEQHESISVATDFPVEDGANISDHIHKQPKTVSVEVFVSNVPTRSSLFPLRVGQLSPVTLQLPQQFNPSRLFRGAAIVSPGAGVRTALAAAEGRLTPRTLEAMVLQFPAPFDAVVETHEKLDNIQEEGANLRLVTGLTEYSNMALIRVGVPVTVEDGTGATFQLDFKRIRKVTPGVVEAPQIPAEPNGAPKKNRGGKASKTIDETASKKARKSLAVSILLKGGVIQDELLKSIDP